MNEHINTEYFWGKFHTKQEGFLRCQTPASTVRLKIEGRRVNQYDYGRR